MITDAADRMAEATAAFKRYLVIAPPDVGPDCQQQAQDYINQHGG